MPGILTVPSPETPTASHNSQDFGKVRVSVRRKTVIDSLQKDPAMQDVERNVGVSRPRDLIASLIETSKLNGVDPFAYLKAALEAIATGHPHSRIDQPLPWAFEPTSSCVPHGG